MNPPVVGGTTLLDEEGCEVKLLEEGSVEVTSLEEEGVGVKQSVKRCIEQTVVTRDPLVGPALIKREWVC